VPESHPLCIPQRFLSLHFSAHKGSSIFSERKKISLIESIISEYDYPPLRRKLKVPPCKNEVYTASLSYYAPFPLNLWEIYLIAILVQGEKRAKLA
jgi:hypothetical protein